MVQSVMVQSVMVQSVMVHSLMLVYVDAQLSDSDGDSMLTVPDFFELYYCILAVVAAIALDPSQVGAVCCACNTNHACIYAYTFADVLTNGFIVQTVPVERIRGGLRTAALTLTSHLMVAFGLSPSDMDQKIG